VTAGQFFKKFSPTILGGAGIFLILMCGQSSTQGLGALSQLLGGSSNHSRTSTNSGGAVSVQREAAPYIGKFEGKQQGPGTRFDTQFACYPAHDAALPHSNTFVCYTPEASNSGTE
jgi:hypothetical protein